MRGGIRVMDDINVSNHKPKCICCKIELKFYTPIEGNLDLDYQMWEGEVFKVCPGYGSSHDTDILIMGICDDCISKGLEDKSILRVGSYL